MLLLTACYSGKILASISDRLYLPVIISTYVDRLKRELENNSFLVFFASFFLVFFILTLILFIVLRTLISYVPFSQIFFISSRLLFLVMHFLHGFTLSFFKQGAMFYTLISCLQRNFIFITSECKSVTACSRNKLTGARLTEKRYDHMNNLSGGD